MIRRKRVFESDNLYRHADWAIDQVKDDLEILLKIQQSLNPSEFNEGRLRSVIKNIKNILAYLHSAYSLESKIDDYSDENIAKKRAREAEDEMERARVKATYLINALKGFIHKFDINP